MEALRTHIPLLEGVTAIVLIEHEYEMALSLLKCNDLTPRERAAAHLLAVTSNHRMITWQRELAPDGNNHAPTLGKEEADALAHQTRDAANRYAAFLPYREAEVMLEEWCFNY